MPTYTHHAAGTASWVDLISPDLEAATRFYGSVLGWSFTDSSEEYGGYRMAHRDGQTVAGIGPKPAGLDVPSTWTLYYASSDLRADAVRIVELGGMVILPPGQVGDAGHMMLAADPTGAVFGLWQAAEHIGMGLKDEPGSLAWSEVNTREPERAREFYEALLGASSLQISETPLYHTLHHGDLPLSGVLGMNEHWPAEIPAHWMTYFAVQNMDEALRRVVQSGGQVNVPAFDTPYGRVAVVQDPGGAVFSVMQPPSASA